MGSTATIQDIANRANVSKSTVSRVINNTSLVNEEKRQAVVEAMRSLGFQPNVFAQGLASGQSMTIGILTQNIGSPFYDTVAQGVVTGLAGTGYSPIFVDGQWQQSTESEVIKTLLRRQVDGLVLIGGDVPVSELNELREHTPTIVVGRELPGWDNQCVHTDNFHIGYLGTKCLIDHGHSQILEIRGIEHHPDAIQRHEGYCQALAESGINYDPDLVYQGDFTAQSGVLAVSSVLSRGKHFSAVFAANDMAAFGARLAAHRHGLRVPEDVSIVGVDDQPESAFVTPPLTTVAQPALEMGVAATDALLSLIRDESYEQKKLCVELKVRESVARLRKQ